MPQQVLDFYSISDFAVAGLLFDIFGAATLGYTMASARDEFIGDKLLMYWGGNPKVVQDACQQTYDMQWGLGWLIGGFWLQMVGALNVRGNGWGLLICGVVLVFSWVLMISLRSRVVRRRSERMLTLAHKWN
jgi:hypothetical protein